MAGAANMLGDPLNTVPSSYAGFFPQLKRHDDAEFDITAMIDLVFMMNIYFLVTFIGAALGEIALPAANNAAALDAEIATIITVLAGRDANSVVVYLGDGTTGKPLHDAEEQTAQIAAAVEAGAARNKTAVLIKAEKTILLREINRLAAAASHTGVTLHIAVAEKDTAP
jgi:biopolymer transport protein ExbD